MFQIISDIISVLEACLYYMYYSPAVSVLVLGVHVLLFIDQYLIYLKYFF